MESHGISYRLTQWQVCICNRTVCRARCMYIYIYILHTCIYMRIIYTDFYMYITLTNTIEVVHNYSRYTRIVCRCLHIMYVHMYKYMESAHTRNVTRIRMCCICITIICLLEEYGDVYVRTYNIDTGRKRSGITGDSTITSIDEQLTRGIGSARVIDLPNLPLRPARC